MTQSFQAGRYNVPILYEDNHLFVIVKPANMPAQGDASGDLSALDACRTYIEQAYHKPGRAYLGLVHRLDRPVGGVLLFARTSKAASRLSEAFRSRTVEKDYLAIVQGAAEAPVHPEDYLLRDERTGNVRVVDGDMPGAKRAELIATPVSVSNGRTLFTVRLLTGRKHQIRVQLAHAGYPIVGDQRYDPSAEPGTQIALWAYRLRVAHPTTKEMLDFKAPPDAVGAWRDFSEAWRSIE